MISMTTSRSSEQGRANRAPPPVDPLTARLVSWSEGNASLMALAVAGGWLAGSLRWTVAAAAGSFLALIVGFRRRWTPRPVRGSQPHHRAALARRPCPAAGGLPGSLVARPGSPGHPLRRRPGRLGGAALGSGFDLRPGLRAGGGCLFLAGLVSRSLCRGSVGGLGAVPGNPALPVRVVRQGGEATRSTAPGNGFTRAVAVLAILALIACLLPVERVCPGAAWAATVALSASFLYSTWRLYRPAA